MLENVVFWLDPEEREGQSLWLKSPNPNPGCPMSTISPQFSVAVNEFPEELRQPTREPLVELKKIFDVSTHTPSSFALAEADLVAAIIAFGRDLIVELAAQFATSSERLSVSRSEGEPQEFRRLEPTPCKIITPFGRGSLQRSLYREVGVHNGPTIDPVAVRCGLMKNATPRAVQLTGAFVAAVPSREVETLFQQLGIDTLSRSTIERTAQAFGERLEEYRDELDTVLINEFEIPEDAMALSVCTDRVAVPIEKPIPRGPGRPKKDSPSRPIEVIYQMAYVHSWTLYGAEGAPLYTSRGG